MDRRQEQRALLFLQYVMFAVVIGALFYWLLDRGEEEPSIEQLLAAEARKGNTEADSWDGSHNSSNDATLNGKKEVEGFPFDPNTADEATLSRLGFSPFQVRNILRYRSKGGQYHRPDDLKRIYGLTVGQWKHLAPYVRIGKDYQYLSDQPGFQQEHRSQYGGRNSHSPSSASPEDEGKTATGSVVSSSSSTSYGNEMLRYNNDVPRVSKLRTGERIDLAKADTNELKKVPGIGGYYARRIAEYGKKLGGFVSPDQLNDEALDFLPVGLEQWMTVSNPSVKKLHINKMTVRELSSHPYISYRQAKQIANRVRLYGAFHSWDELLFLKEFNETDKVRLEPYVSFE